MRCTLAGAVAVLLASAALTAADFWEEKDFTTWSPQQIDKILTDSPWAKKATLVLGAFRQAGPAAASSRAAPVLAEAAALRGTLTLAVASSQAFAGST